MKTKIIILRNNNNSKTSGVKLLMWLTFFTIHNLYIQQSYKYFITIGN